MKINLKLGVVGMLLATSAANAQVSTIEAYCLSQLPNNSIGSITPQTLRNCINYLTENLSTVPYTGQVSTAYPLVAMGANISGTVSATYVNTTSLTLSGFPVPRTGYVLFSGSPGVTGTIVVSDSLNLSPSTIAKTATGFYNLQVPTGFCSASSTLTPVCNGENGGTSAVSFGLVSATGVSATLRAMAISSTTDSRNTSCHFTCR